MLCLDTEPIFLWQKAQIFVIQYGASCPKELVVLVSRRGEKPRRLVGACLREQHARHGTAAMHTPPCTAPGPPTTVSLTSDVMNSCDSKEAVHIASAAGLGSTLLLRTRLYMVYADKTTSMQARSLVF